MHAHILIQYLYLSIEECVYSNLAIRYQKCGLKVLRLYRRGVDMHTLTFKGLFKVSTTVISRKTLRPTFLTEQNA